MLTDTLLPDVYFCELPSNITPLNEQVELYGYGVRLLRFVQVADVAQAIEKAGRERAFLLKSKVLPCYYLIFPIVTVTEWKEKHDPKPNR